MYQLRDEEPESPTEEDKGPPSTQPVSKGIAVYCAYKWILMTLDNRRRMPTDVYRFPRHLAKERDGKESTYFLSRLRDYACRNMQVSVQRIPYFVHAIALLDAFQMARMFTYWKWYHQQIQRIRRQELRQKKRYYFTQWRIFKEKNELLENCRVSVARRREKRLVKQSFRNWRVQFKAFLRQRVCVVPFHRRRCFRRWLSIAKSRRWQAAVAARGRHHFLRQLQRRAVLSWTRHLCRLSQAQKALQSGDIHSWTLSAVKHRFFAAETLRGRGIRRLSRRSSWFVAVPGAKNRRS